MTQQSAAMPTLRVAIVSSQCLVWLGLQNILSSMAVPMVVHPCSGRPSDLLRMECRPNLFIVDLETELDILGILTQIREAAPTSKIVLLCGIEHTDRMREAFAAGVDGIILKVQPPKVVLAVIEALYPSPQPSVSVEQDEVRRMGRETIGSKKVNTDSPAPPVWPEALTQREREIIRLVEQGLSNKDIAHELSISDSTVRHHMTNIFDKVGVPNRQKLLVHGHHLRATPVQPL